MMALLGVPLHEGTRDTARRHTAYLREFLHPAPFAMTTFPGEGMSEMVVQRNVHFFALCEHHLVPFFGTAVVGYIPNGRIVGLSKLARAVQFCARQGPQNQERITRAVATMLERELKPRGVGVLLAARHLCYAPDAEVLTDEGWRGVDGLSTSWRVAQFDPASSGVSFVHPTAVQHYERVDDLMIYEGKSLSMAVARGHRHVVQTEWGRTVGAAWSVRALDDIPRGRLIIPRAGVAAGRPRAMTFESLRMASATFAAFMGMWLSEGSVSHTTDDRRRVRITQSSGRGADLFGALCQRLGFRRRSGKNWSLYNGALAEYLRPLGRSPVRRAPREVFGLPPSDRELLLDYFHLGDGYFAEDHSSYGYTTASRGLADDLLRMCVTTGRGATWTRRAAGAYDVRCHRSGDGFSAVAGLQSKHWRIEPYGGSVHCCTVPAGALIVRRRGAPFISGNCMEMRGARTFGAETITSYLSGAMRKNAAARAEFLKLARGGGD